jgi:hypothetical protein
MLARVPLEKIRIASRSELVATVDNAIAISIFRLISRTAKTSPRIIEGRASIVVLRLRLGEMSRSIAKLNSFAYSLAPK